METKRMCLFLCAVFLVLQAIFSLALPYITGDMINIGVQQKGIESLVPTGFSSDGMALMCYVLPKDEEEEFLSFYSYNEATGDYILKSDELSEERAKELYQNGISSAVCIALEELERTNGKNVKVRIIRMRRVPFIDSTGVNNLRSLCERTRKRGVTVILSGVTEKVNATLQKFGVDEEIGKENIFPHIVPALKRASELSE